MEPKANKETLNKIKEQAATFIQLTERKYGVKLDHSEESLVVADDLITIFLKFHKSHYIKAAVYIGSYLGEVIIKNLGGKWLKDYSIKNIGNLKGFAHPITRARKRLANGIDDSIVRYYRNLKLSDCMDSNFAGDREKLDGYGDILLADGWHLELLNRILNNDNPRYVREEAAELFGRLIKDDMNDELVKLASDPDLVYFSAIALQGHPVKEAFEPLLKNLGETDYIPVRQQILLALGKLGDTRAFKEIVPFLNDGDEIVGHFAAIAIGEIGGNFAVDELLNIMAGIHPGNPLHAITALEIIGDKRSVPALIEALFSRDEEVREAAARALQYIPDQSSFKPLVYCLKDRSSRIRIFAAYALASIGNPDAIPYMKKLLKDEVQTVRLHATHLLKWLKKGETPAAKVI
ncbi:MAG: HEAT repeat domain-containing protein [Candidatus Eremiobacteraeota bacterium]|nr:HEAT repeat domain-containing protein [Candidatus Eremiobacteraeota bacterium]